MHWNDKGFGRIHWLTWLDFEGNPRPNTVTKLTYTHANFPFELPPHFPAFGHFDTGEFTNWLELDVMPPPCMVLIYVTCSGAVCALNFGCYIKTNFVALVRGRTIPTERPPPVGEGSANSYGERVLRGQRTGSPPLYSRFSRPENIT
jgi:hypothetical protein